MATAEIATEVKKEWKKMKVQELRDELARRGLSTSGLRPALIERLEKSLFSPENGEAESRDPQSAEPERPSEDTETENHVSNAESTPKEDASGSIADPDNCQDSKSAEPAALVPVEKSSNEAKDNGIASPAAPLSDLEKKHRRAERFGLALQLTEEEKRISRAARFGESSNGTQKPNTPGLGDTKLSEEERRKARAERFGLSPRSSADDEAKKKARLARFGMDAKPDSLEDNKRKARAARFAPAFDENTSEANKKLKPDMTEAVVSS